MTEKEKRIEVKHKLINHLVIHGKKNKSEKIVCRSIKALQMASKKSPKKLLQLALVSNTPIFKINTITQKKRKKRKAKIIPAFISNRMSRVSFAIKFIITTARKKTNKSILQKLSEEVLLSAQDKSHSVEVKKETQKQVLLNRHLFKYYRWH